MILKPQVDDIKNIGYYLGRIILGIGLTMFLPFIAGLVLFREPNPALDFLISANITIFIGLTLNWLCKTDKDLHAGPAMVVIALSFPGHVFLLVHAFPPGLSLRHEHCRNSKVPVASMDEYGL